MVLDDFRQAGRYFKQNNKKRQYTFIVSHLAVLLHFYSPLIARSQLTFMSAFIQNLLTKGGSG